MYIGEQIKQLRKQKNMTLEDLSKASGVQIASLSRIENKRMVGTLESHVAIAKALGIDVTQLYSNIREIDPERIAKDSKFTESFIHNEKASFEILTTKLFSKKMMPILLKIEASGKTTIEENPIGSEKFIFVLAGKIDVFINEEKTTLNKNSSLYFNASLPHYFVNTGEGIAKIISVCTPVNL